MYKFSYDAGAQLIFTEYWKGRDGHKPCMIDVQAEVCAAVVAACVDLGCPIPRIFPAIAEDPDAGNLGTLDLRWDYLGDVPMTAVVFETMVSETRRAVRFALASDAGTENETLVQAAIDA